MKDSIEERVVKVQKDKFGGKAMGANEGGGEGGPQDEAAEADRLARQQRERADAELARRLAEEEAGNVNADKLSKAAVKVEEWDQFFGIKEADLAA